MTYTYAIMEVSPDTYDEIHGKLFDAGYQHAIHDVTFEINHPELGPLMLTMQRRHCETPAQQAAERLDALQEIELIVSQTTERPYTTLSQVQGIVMRQIRKAAGIAG